MRRTVRRALAAALAVAACGGGPGADREVAPPDTAEAPRGEAPPDTGPDVGEAVVDTSGRWTVGIAAGASASTGLALLVDVRAARHEGYDRVTWEFDGTLPGWHVEYIDRPVRECGSGRPVPLPGDGWLEVRFEFAAAHDEAGRSTVERPAAAGLGGIREIVRTCDFEGVVAWVLAVESPEPYRPIELDDPARLAVDVRHPR